MPESFCRGELSGFNIGGCIESGGIGGGGIAFDDVESCMPLFDDNDERSAEADTVGCEKGFPGPRGASVKEDIEAEPGAECPPCDWIGLDTSALFRASDMDGNRFEPKGDSLSSRVDLREFDSGGDI